MVVGNGIVDLMREREVGAVEWVMLTCAESVRPLERTILSAPIGQFVPPRPYWQSAEPTLRKKVLFRVVGDRRWLLCSL